MGMRVFSAQSVPGSGNPLGVFQVTCVIMGAFLGVQMLAMMVPLSLVAYEMDPDVSGPPPVSRVGATVISPMQSSAEREQSVTIASPGVEKKRELLLPEGHFGLSNQMACLNLAAVLAVQYNRTLVVPGNGCAGNRAHGLFPIPFERVYNVDHAAQHLSFRIDESGSQVGNKQYPRKLPARCDNEVDFSTKKIRTDALGKDPYEEEDCIYLSCRWTRIRFVAPPDIFPHVDQAYFRYNDIYRKAANEVITSIKERILAERKEKSKSPFRLLTLHVRRGDRGTVPLFDCAKDLGGLYPNTHVITNEDYPVVCTNKKHRGANFDHVLTWDKFFNHMADPDCKSSSFPVCAGDYDAIFVATNSPDWVRETVAKNKLPPVFLIADFPSIRKYLLPETLKSEKVEEAAEMLLIEEMIMVDSDRNVPSFESSITQQVLRLRLDYHPNEWDMHLLDTYYKLRGLAHQKRWPDQYK